MADHDDDLAEAVRELTRTIDDLRTELESTQRRSPLRPRAPRPPTPRELLEFTDEIAIPAAIAVLETSVRALEGFQRALQLARTEREVRDRTADATRSAGKRADDLRQSTLSRLDTVLAELQRASSEGTLPADDEARTLLTEARELRDDVERRLREAGDAGSGDLESGSNDLEGGPTDATDAVRIDVEDGNPFGDGDGPSADDDPTADSDPGVDVDAELETLKDQYGDDGDDASERSATGTADAGGDDGDDTETTDTDGATADGNGSDADENDSDGT